MKYRLTKHCSILVSCVGLFLFADTSQAQRLVRLVEYTNVWKYNDSGADLGTAWRGPGFNDSAWPSGPGLFGVESNSPPPYAVRVRTPLAFGQPQIITYYFRTRFNYGAVPLSFGSILRANVYADDGCVIYLNGVEAGRVRVPAGQNYQTVASSGLPGVTDYEGQSDSIEVNTNLLVPGENLLAVELHQVGVGSSDMIFGMRLTEEIPEPLTITSHPTNQASIVLPGASGTPVFFTVEVSGGPVRYQWKRNGTDVPGAVGWVLNIPQPVASNAGEYTVVVSNALGSVTSAAATLTVGPPPGSSPTLLSAVVRTNTFQTNQITITFSEPLTILTATNLQNYALTALSSGNTINLLSAHYSFGMVRLVFESLLDPAGNYYLTVNNLTDTSNNVIAANSQIGVSWPMTTNLLEGSHVWRYHANALQDLSIHDAAWWKPAYIAGGFWQQGAGLFSVSGWSDCIGTTATLLPYQKPPTLFRTTFVIPEGVSEIQEVRFRYSSASALVLHLNAEEIYRSSSLPPPPVALGINTRATGIGGVQDCTGVSIPSVKLRAGTNWLTAAVFQNADGSQISQSTGPLSFGASVEAGYFRTSPVPSGSRPRLMTTWFGAGQLQLSWTGPGYILETTTNITAMGTNTVVGPWTEVPGMANPYSVTISNEPLRLFRLRK